MVSLATYSAGPQMVRHAGLCSMVHACTATVRHPAFFASAASAMRRFGAFRYQRRPGPDLMRILYDLNHREAPTGITYMATVFISYSRVDKEFVGSLRDALDTRGWDAWVDLEDIRESAAWLPEVQHAIDSAEIFIFVLSPDSLTSTFCAEELSYAIRNNKKLVPVELRDIKGIQMRTELSDLAWVDFKTSDFPTALGRLIGALETDLDWARVHARLQVRAREWESRGREKSLVLRGKDLTAVERDLVAYSDSPLKLTPLQIEFVVQSRSAARYRRWVAVGSLVALSLSTSGAAAWIALGTPSWSWMPTQLDIGVSRLARIADGVGERFRVLTRYVDRSPHSRYTEVGGVEYTVVLELDVMGRKLGCFAYATIDYSFAGVKEGPCEVHGGKGSLANTGSPATTILSTSESNDDLGLTLVPWSYFFVGGGKALLLDELDPSEARWVGIDLSRDAVNGARRAAREVADRASPRVKLFALDATAILAFVEVYAGRDWSGYGTVSLRSNDGGNTWRTSGRVTEGLSAPGIRDIAIASKNANHLYLAATDTRAPETPNGVEGGILRSDDGGLSWERLLIPDPWSGWNSFRSVSVVAGGTELLAVAGGSTDPNHPDPGVLTKRSGEPWKSLRTGLPNGVTPNSITAASHDRLLALIGGDQLVVWRKLSLLERLQGTYGVSTTVGR